MIRPFCDCADFVEIDRKIDSGEIKKIGLRETGFHDWALPSLIASLLGALLYHSGLRPLAFIVWLYPFVCVFLIGFHSLTTGIHVCLYRHKGGNRRAGISIAMILGGIAIVFEICVLISVAFIMPWSLTLEPIYALFNLVRFMQ